jgi:lipoprotein signal peptidase
MFNVVIGSLAPAAALFLLDRWSKKEVRLKFANGRVFSAPFFQIRYVAGLKWLYQRPGVRLLLVLVWLVSLISAVVLYHSGAWFQSHPALIGLGLAFSGALGNLLDILQNKYVVDFVDLRWWPVFNLADVGIISGLALAFFH